MTVLSRKRQWFKQKETQFSRCGLVVIFVQKASTNFKAFSFSEKLFKRKKTSIFASTQEYFDSKHFNQLFANFLFYFRIRNSVVYCPDHFMKVYNQNILQNKFSSNNTKRFARILYVRYSNFLTNYKLKIFWRVKTSHYIFIILSPNERKLQKSCTTVALDK